MASEDIRVLVPRVRRAVEGVGEPEVLSDDDVKDLIADALADVILFTGGVFGKELLVTERDPATGAPSEYATSDPLTLAEGSIVAYQAALTAVWQTLGETKVSETIRDEGSEWSYQLSATLLRDRIKILTDMRDQALQQLTVALPVAFYDYLVERELNAIVALQPYLPAAP